MIDFPEVFLGSGSRKRSKQLADLFPSIVYCNSDVLYLYHRWLQLVFLFVWQCRLEADDVMRRQLRLP